VVGKPEVIQLDEKSVSRRPAELKSAPETEPSFLPCAIFAKLDAPGFI